MNQSKPNKSNGSARRGSKSAQSKRAKNNGNQLPSGQSNPIPPRAGEKRVFNPAAKARVVQTQKPRLQNAGNGDIIISHREYVKDIPGSVAFANSGTLSLNPGMPGVFSWLSTIARSYESYCFEKLEIDFETQAPTTLSGTVVLAVDYDPSDPAPTSKAQAMAYRSSVRCPTWSDCRFKAEKEDLSKRKTYFVRSSALSANQDIKLYDVGSLYPCTMGTGTTVAIGELYIDYTVKLMTPQLGSIGVGESVFGIFTGSANSAPFGDAVSGGIPAAYTSAGTTTSISTWTFSGPWEGYVSVNVVGTGIVSITPSGTATSLELAEVENAAATQGVAIYSVSAAQLQTFILTIANTTITAASAYFGQADS